MSHLPGNPHYKPTLESISDFGEYTIAVEGVTDATIIWQGLADQAQATLALAYEQRTALLWSILSSESMSLNGVDYKAIEAEIKARLGLGETK